MKDTNPIKKILDEMSFNEKEEEIFLESIKLTKSYQKDSSINVNSITLQKIRGMVQDEIQKNKV
ncbi:hypothetical protein [Terrisporobacter sp.]